MSKMLEVAYVALQVGSTVVHCGTYSYLHANSCRKTALFHHSWNIAADWLNGPLYVRGYCFDFRLFDDTELYSCWFYF